jgi:hypothetical protein
MPFTYPTTPHTRRHSPAGYTDYTSFKPWLRDEFVFCCVFCRIRERFYPTGQDAFAVEHLTAQVARPDLACVYTNLVYACLKCNSFKGDRGPVPDPCETAYGSHLRIEDDGTIRALSDEGRLLVRLLRLDRPDVTELRGRFLRLARRVAADPASDWAGDVSQFFRYPLDLPDLRGARPPSNAAPASATDCFFARRERRQLVETY